jgi:hypothetical protein
MFALAPSVSNENEAVPSENPKKIPSCSKLWVTCPMEIYGLAYPDAESALSAITGLLLSPVPMFTVLLAYTSCANKISVATEVNSAPNDSQPPFHVPGVIDEPIEVHNPCPAFVISY